MYSYNYSKSEKKFLIKGYIIKKVENKKSLKYLERLIKKALYKTIKKKISKKMNLNKLHQFIEEKNLNKYRLDIIKSINRDKKFKENYYMLAKNILSEIVGNELAMQNNINLSLQLPNDESSLLPLHSDTWSGDSPFECVLWIPLVNCYGSKSMFILNAKKLQNFHKSFSNKKIKNVSDLFNKFKKDLKFIKIKFGEYLLFNQNLPHGNLVNSTKETRVSLNCRFKGLFTPYSQKELGSFFSPLTIKPATRIGLEYNLPTVKKI